MKARRLMKNLKSLLKIYGDAEVLLHDSRHGFLKISGVYADCFPDYRSYILFPRTSEEQKAILKEEVLKKS